MKKTYQHLGVFSEIVSKESEQTNLLPCASPGLETQENLIKTLGFKFSDENPQDVKTERTWMKDGIAGEEVSWSCGYGPRTKAWVLKPAGNSSPMPGILALHDHGGFKYFGKEKIAEDDQTPHPVMVDFRKQYYGDRAYANELAKRGNVVLIQDTFLWGSRRFPLVEMPEEIRHNAGILTQSQSTPPQYPEIETYNQAAGLHEHIIEKYCNLLGTTLAGVVNYEDRIGVNYLLSRSDIDSKRIGCLGLSGGGARTVLLQGTCNDIKAAVTVGLMCTYYHLLDHNISCHTWMIFPSGWIRYGDWPDIAGARAPSPLMVQYDLEDELFTKEGMHAADLRLKEHYESVGKPENYTGKFYPGPHKFDQKMQEDAFEWLAKQL